MRRGTILFLLALLAFAGFALWAGPAMAQDGADAAAGIQWSDQYGPHLPTDVSKDGYKIDRLINYLHVFMIVLFVAWGAFFLWCLVKFRARAGVKAEHGSAKGKLAKYSEIAVVCFEAFLLIGLSIPVWNYVKADPPAELGEPYKVRVVAEQFQWNFHYSGADGEFGRTGAAFVDLAINPVGVDPSDPAGADDVQAGEFHIPVDRPIVVELSSKDVIHSFFLPNMRVKQDAVPGMRIPIWFQATKTGTYPVACAQLCGNNHYSMKATMVIESQEAFDAWLVEKGTVEEFDEDEFD